MDNPESTMASFNRQFGLNAPEKEDVEWACPMEMGDNMFAVVNTYTRAAQWDELTAESSFRLSRVGENIREYIGNAAVNMVDSPGSVYGQNAEPGLCFILELIKWIDKIFHLFKMRNNHK